MATTYLTDGPLSSRKSGKTVSRVNTDRSRQRRNEGGGKRNRGDNGQLSAEDMISLFQSVPVPNRGYKNPNAAQPAKMGGGLDCMDKNNSPDLVAQRQNQTDWAQGQGRDRARLLANSAVAEAKALNGYTDASGKFVPGMDKGPPSSAYGTGSVRQLAPGEKARGTMPHPITGEQVFMNDYLAGQEQVQNTKYGPGRDEFGEMKAGPSAAQAGLDYFNPQKMTMPTPVKSRPAPQPQNDLSGLFPGNAKLTDVPPANFSLPPGHPLANEQPAAQQPNTPAELNWFDRRVAANPDGIFSKIAEIGGMLPGMPQTPQLTQNGILPDMMQGANALLYGIGDAYSNYIGRPLDQFLLGIQPPPEPSDNMRQYQKSVGQKQGWW